MKKEVEDRLWVAERVSQSYETHASTLAGFVFGSVAYGNADRFSDLEVGILWDYLPDEEGLHQLCQDVGGKEWNFQGFLGPAQGYLAEKKWLVESYFFTGLKITLAHWSRAGLDETVESVLSEFDVSRDGWVYENQATLSIIQHAKILFGNAVLAGLRERIKTYPDQLAIRMIEENLKLGNLSELRRYAVRRDVPILQSLLIKSLRNVYGLIYGLNKIYAPGYKWNRYFIESMCLGPGGIVDKLDVVLEASPSIAVERYGEVVETVLNLVERKFPQIPLREIRAELYREDDSWERSS